MTPEEQRIAIAEFCGWSHRPEKYRYKGGIRVYDIYGRPNDYGCLNYDMPDYQADLNAMHEAEKILLKSSPGYYDRAYFFAIVLAVDGIDIAADGVPDIRSITDCVSATAEQRAEAFLKTIGKWINP